MNPTPEVERIPIQCCGCKKKFFPDGFKVTRLGRRMKTCIECNDRQRLKQRRYLDRKNSAVAYKDACLTYFKRTPILKLCWLNYAHERGLDLEEPWKHPYDFLVCVGRYEDLQQSVTAEVPKAPQLTDDEVTDQLAELGI